MPTTKREEAQQALAQLFERLGISRIICVDDVYALPSGYEDAVGLIVELGSETATPIINNDAIPLGGEVDIWVEQFKIWWQSLSEAHRRLLLQRMTDARAGDGNKKNEHDLNAANALSELFNGREFLQLSPSQWKDQREERLRESQTHKTLFLFDEDLRNGGGTETGGRELIRDVLDSAQAQTAMCGLLSHNFPAEQEYEIWKKFKSVDYQFQSERVVPVSKSTLETKPLEFARAIKLTVLNPYCQKLTKHCARLLKSSLKKAQARLEEINIYEFDRLVFRTSNREGIWEPDTLFRLHNLFQRIEARSRATKGHKLRRMAEQIRAVSDIPTDDNSEEKRTDAWKIQRLERYESGEFINGSLLPIELGDIFEKTGSNKARKPCYILLAQPCDLMVRSKTGNRKKAMSQVVLARISHKRLDNSDASYELHYFDPENGDSGFVNFTETHLVSLRALDLCAFNTEGIAKIKIADKPKNAILAWSKHHQELKEFVKRLIESRGQVQQLLSSYNESQNATKQIPATLVDSLSPEFSSPPLFQLEVDPAAKSISFDCKRIGRFNQNHAAALWTKFCNYTARAAFEVDLGA